MTNVINVYVEGRPRPQPRARPVVHCALANKRGGAKCPATVVSTMSGDIADYRRLVRDACKQAAASEDFQRVLADNRKGLSFLLLLWFPTSDDSRWGTPHITVPDADNVGKLWQDAAVDAGLITRGDGRVANLQVLKIWNRTAGAMLRVAPIDPDDFFDLVSRLAEDDDDSIAA